LCNNLLSRKGAIIRMIEWIPLMGCMSSEFIGK